MPFIEEQALRDAGRGFVGTQRIEAIVQRDATPIAIMNCPSRRPPIPYPNTAGILLRNGGQGDFHARSDYAINIGDTIGYEHWSFHFAPFNYAEGDQNGWVPELNFFTGISYCGSQVRVRQVKDGLSHTYAIGEKYLDPRHYRDGAAASDDAPMYGGVQNDLFRSTYFDDSFPPTLENVRLPHQDKRGVNLNEHFGSAHTGGWYASMCDGSVHFVAYEMDGFVHARRGNRADGAQN